MVSRQKELPQECSGTLVSFRAVSAKFKRNKVDGPGIVFAIPGAIVISLQTARKPNSVLDDHSSTRRITAAL